MNPEVEICRTFSPYYVNNYSVSFYFSFRLGTSQWIFQEYHYDCVLDANEARNLRKQDEKNKEKKKKERKDKEKEKKGFMGYNLPCTPQTRRRVPEAQIRSRGKGC